MDLKEQILSIANENLTDESHFVVDVVISKTKGPKKILVLLDGDEGITIDDCVALSRAIGGELEESDLVDTAYTLEVSSPGVDYPLALPRQFAKNIGRTVKVSLKEGKEVKGELQGFDEDNLILTQSKGKNKETKEVLIPFSTINKTIVQISFK